MYRNSNGEIVFEQENEVRNFMKAEYSEQAIKEKAAKKNMTIAVHDNPLTYRTLKQAVKRFLGNNPKYQKEHTLFNMCLDAAAKHGIELKYTLSFAKHELKWSDDELRSVWRRGMDVIKTWLNSRIVKPTMGDIAKHGY